MLLRSDESSTKHSPFITWTPSTTSTLAPPRYQQIQTKDPHQRKKHMSAGKMLPVELAARALVSSPTPAKVNSLQWAKQEHVVRRIGGLALL